MLEFTKESQLPSASPERYTPPKQSTLRDVLSRSTSPLSSNLSLASSDISDILSDFAHLPDDFRHSPPGSFMLVETVRVPKSAYDSLSRKLQDLEKDIANVADNQQDLLTRLFAERKDMNVQIDIDDTLIKLLDFAARDTISAVELELQKEMAARKASEAGWYKERIQMKNKLSSEHQLVLINTYLMLCFYEALAKERKQWEELEKRVEQERETVDRLEASLTGAERDKVTAMMCLENEKEESVKMKTRFEQEKALQDKELCSLVNKVEQLENELAVLKQKENKEREEKEKKRREEESKKKEQERKEQEERNREEQKHREEERQKQCSKKEKTASVPLEWSKYEAFWATIHCLIGRPNQTFASIRWPMIVQPDTPDDIKVEKIKKFVLSLSHSEGRPNKQRVKDALLRWHPDKFQRVLEKVKPGEVEKVLLGADLVVKHLNAVMEKL